LWLGGCVFFFENLKNHYFTKERGGRTQPKGSTIGEGIVRQAQKEKLVRPRTTEGAKGSDLPFPGKSNRLEQVKRKGKKRKKDALKTAFP